MFYDRFYWLTHWGFVGMVGVLIAAMSGAFALVWLRRKEETIEPLKEVTAQIFITVLTFILLSLFFESFPETLMSVKLGISVAYLAIVGTAIAFLIYYWLAKHTTALMISFSVFITPIFAVFLGWVFLKESYGLIGIIGVVMVIGSIFIVQKR